MSKEIAERIANSHEVMKDAIGKHAKPMAAALRKYGKRATPQWVAAQGTIQTVNRANILEMVETWVTAFVEADNLAGLEIFKNEIELTERLARANRSKRLNGTTAPPLTRAEIEQSLVKVEVVVRQLKYTLENDTVLKRAEEI